MRDKVRAAILGTGFMGRVHLEALCRLGYVDVRGVASGDPARGKRLAGEFGLGEIETDLQRILADDQIQVVHVCSPTGLHEQHVTAALHAGKHVLSEKPLATSTAGAAELVRLAAEQGVRNCTNQNLRYYPLVQHMRGMCEAGELGEILVVQGTYSQDYLLLDTDWNWRLDPAESGPSCALADVGSHWCDMAEHVTGLHIESVCADLNTFHKIRKKPKRIVETFAGKMDRPDDIEDVEVKNEDFAAVLLHLSGGARGSFTVGEVMAGRKNRLSMEIYGTKGSVAWDQERPNELWMGSRTANNQLLIKDGSLLNARGRGLAHVPGGHAEGYPDTFKNIFSAFYESVTDASIKPDYPQFADGLRQMRVLEAELKSHQSRGWMDIPAS